MPFAIHQFVCLKDNYGVLLHDPETGAVASIDAPEAGPILRALDQHGWTLTDVLVTHHHQDHTQGLDDLKARFPGVRIVAPAKEAAKIPSATVTVVEGDTVQVGSQVARVIETPGHTAGHIVYWFERDGLLFAGDTLFALGCGRVFETPLPEMFHSLNKLKRLPPETTVYCGHEYTASNARFALMVDPKNEQLARRAAEVERLRHAGTPTLPTTIALERATNPFLRTDDPDVQAAIGLLGSDPVSVFGELRERKNRA